jgi:uncharacterized 2Fe-2S/4Fe-4S cluster protein (DUF4445 family)
VEHDCEVVPGEVRQAVIPATANAALKTVVKDSGLAVCVDGTRQRVMYRGQQLLFRDAGSPFHPCGLAVDIGTTTVAVYLADLTTHEVLDVASVLNPQAAYGQDVIARINYVIERPEGLRTLQSRIAGGVADCIRLLCARNRIDPESIYLCTVVGNTTMLHLFLGVSPATIGQAPYTPVFLEERTAAPAELGLPMHPRGMVRTLPSLSGYVGADIVAGVAATPMLQRERFSLFLDIGTNGEMALGNRDVLYCCATAAGPAFEGARISCGVGGIEGAIAHFDGGGYATIGSAPPVGLCGSGLLDLVALLLDKRVIDAAGYMESAYVVVPAPQSGTGQPIVLTPQDIREVQLAKAAIRAGIEILLKHAGVSGDDLEHVYLAGGFGTYLRVESALRIGMLPPHARGKVAPIGNSAGIGSLFALQSLHFDNDIQMVVRRAACIELSMRLDFNDAFVNAMVFE